MTVRVRNTRGLTANNPKDVRTAISPRARVATEEVARAIVAILGDAPACLTETKILAALRERGVSMNEGAFAAATAWLRSRGRLRSFPSRRGRRFQLIGND